MGVVGETPVPGFIRDAQRRAAAAIRPSNTSPTRTMTALVRAGWDYKERSGKRIWSHEEVNGGHWYSEETAVQVNDERKV